MKYLFITSDNFHDLHYRTFASGTRKHLSLHSLWEQFIERHNLVDQYSPDRADDVEYLVNIFQFTGNLKLMTGELEN